MTEAQLRALVRDAIARHNAGATPVAQSPASSGAEAITFVRAHASHAMFSVPAGSDMDGPCVIEPAVRCNHCGYCKSFGH